MITKLILSATLTFIVTSCTTSHATDDVTKKPIGFEDTYITKGAYTQSNGNFGVLGLEYSASAPTPPYDLIYKKFNNQEIVVKTSGDNTSFTYSPIQYWTKGKNVDFFAYSPYDPNIGFDFTADDITITHNVPNVKKENQIDLLYAEPQKNKNEIVSKNQVIRFPFKHALTKVKISARLYAANPLSVKLISVELKDIDSEADISIKDGKVTISTNNLITYAYRNIDAELPDSDTDSDGSIDHLSLNELLLIPQDVSGKVIKVYYTVGDDLDDVLEKSVTLPVNSRWHAGQCVHYRLIIKLDNEIQFSADVEDWPGDIGSEM